MRTLISILFILISISCYSQSYKKSFYVSSTGSGTGIGTQADPWTGAQLETILESGAYGIPIGSTIYFNKGETFAYQFDLDRGNIKFDSYGSGDKPIITGSDDIGSLSWTLDSGDIYYCTMASEPKAVFVNGKEVKMAETAWISILGRPTQLTFNALATTMDALDGVEALEGSYIVCKEWPFRPTYRRTVTNYVTGSPNGTLTVDAAPNTDAAGATTGMPFKLLNKKSFITEVGEWMWDDATDRLYIKTSGSSPAGTDIRISTRDYGIVMSPSSSNISISNLYFEHQFLEGVYSTHNHRPSVNACDFKDLRTNAASFTGNGVQATVTNSTFERISNNAIHIGSIIGGNFSNNTFDSLGTQSGVSIPQYSYFRSVGCGIHMRWDDTGTIWVPQDIVVRDNVFTDIGYIPIVNTGIGNLVEGNYINGYDLTWNDGGGIYSTNVYGVLYGNGSDTRDCIIQDNLVMNGLLRSRTLEGITGIPTQIHGIYVDNNCSDITVQNNWVENIASAGILINNSTDNCYVGYNTVVDFEQYGIWFRRENDAPDATNLYPNSYGHTMVFNKIASLTSTAEQLGISEYDAGASYNPFANGGACDNNRYINPYSLNMMAYGNDVDPNTTYTFAGWQALYSLDASATTDMPGHLYVNAAKAAIDVVTQTNITGSPTTLTPSSEYYYLDETGTHQTSVTVQPTSGRLMTRQYFPIVTTLLDDTFTGGAGNLTGHTPDVGTWVIQSGTFALDGSGYLTSSVAGNITASGGAYKNVEIEITGQVSATGGLNPIGRWISGTDRVAGQLFIDSGGLDYGRIINDASTIEQLQLVTYSLNTDYTIKYRVENGTVTIWLGGVVMMQRMDDATIRASNTSTFVHGLSLGTTGKINRITIKELSQ